MPIDISKIKVPRLLHLHRGRPHRPWKSTYLGAKLFSGPVRFVLGGSGHIAGIVNPPAANKYGFWINDAAKLPATADDFPGRLHPTSGFLVDRLERMGHSLDGGKKVAARKPGAGNLKVLEDAPGSYVKFRLDTQKKESA